MNMTSMSALVLALALLITGCSEKAKAVDSDGIATDGKGKPKLGSGSVEESSDSNGEYAKAQSVGFENNKFSISGSANSTDDTADWYVFSTPESGKYICGMKYADGVDFTAKAYHQGNSAVGGESGYTYQVSNADVDAGYKALTVPVLAVSPVVYDIPKGDNVYIKVEASSTGGNTVDYKFECFSPSAYVSQTGTIVENDNLINRYFASAQPVKFDSSNALSISGKGNSTSDQYDAYRFTTSIGGDYNITLTHDNGVDFDLKLYNKDKTVKSGISNSTKSSQSWIFSALSNADYYLDVQAYSTGGSTAEYTVSVVKK